MKIEDGFEIKCITAFMYSECTFTHSGKCKEVLNRNQQASKATRILNSILWSKHSSLNTKKQMFFAVVENI
jgi:hypothetical protein